MIEWIKKIFSVLNALPNFTQLFKKASQTGTIDPAETLEVLSSISPSTKKCADMAMQTVQRGGNIQDVAANLANIGEIEIIGQKINTRTMTSDLKKAGGICSLLGNMLEKMQSQSPEEIVEFGKHASRVNNWADFVKN